MFKLFNPLFVLAVFSFFASGCAAILAPGSQDVKFDTGSNDAKVHVNGDEAGEGHSVTTTLEKDLIPKQIEINKDGYVENYFVINQTERHSLFWLSVVPFGPVTMFGLLDRGSKTFEFEESFETPFNDIPKVEREDNQRYVFLFDTSFDIEDESFTLNLYNYDDYRSDAKPFNSITSEEDLSIDGDGPTQQLNNLLHEYNFIDTTENIFRDKTNTLNVSAEINDIEINEVYMQYFNSSYPRTFYTTKLEITWEVYDVYRQKLHDVTIETTSGEIVRDDFQNALSYTISDAMYISLFKFLSSDEVQELIEIEEDTEIDLEPYTITRGTHPTSVDEAQKSTVTIKTDGGHGSGCIVGKEGYIATNFHVVSASDEINVLIDGQEYEAELVRKNEFDDLALVKIEKEFEYTHDITNAPDLSSGENVYAVGTPASVDLGQTVNRGIVSGFRDHEGSSWIQTDVSVSSGNSGGALIDEDGAYQGIVAAKMVGYTIDGITFAIPVDRVGEGLNIQYSDMP